MTKPALGSTVALALAVLWLVTLLPGLVGVTARPTPPFDFLSYREAADALARGASPYLTPTQTLDIWRAVHADEGALFSAYREGRGPEVLRERPQRPGPYIYPPTLARIVGALHVSAVAFSIATVLSLVGFAWLWLRASGAAPGWALAVAGSWDVTAMIYGGNIELLLLFVTLVVAWALWARRPLVAAPLIALALLVKPFYVLAFVVLALVALVTMPERVATMRTLAVTAALAIALVVVDALAWGAPLRAETLAYLRRPFDYLWFVLPVAEQTPMSIWNRTPLQAFITFGLSTATAQALALGLWLLLSGVTVWQVRGRRLTFPVAFALAFTLLYLGRPVGWALLYFELVVGVVAWPTLGRGGRVALAAAGLALMASHWAALVRTAAGAGMPFLTLQRPELPWETLLVLPAGWLLVLRAALRYPPLREST